MDRLKPTLDFEVIKQSRLEAAVVPKPIKEFKAYLYAVRWICEACFDTTDLTRPHITGGSNIPLLIIDNIYDSRKSTWSRSPAVSISSW